MMVVKNMFRRNSKNSVEKNNISQSQKEVLQPQDLFIKEGFIVSKLNTFNDLRNFLVLKINNLLKDKGYKVKEDWTKLRIFRVKFHGYVERFIYTKDIPKLIEKIKSLEKVPCNNLNEEFLITKFDNLIDYLYIDCDTCKDRFVFGNSNGNTLCQIVDLRNTKNTNIKYPDRVRISLEIEPNTKNQNQIKMKTLLEVVNMSDDLFFKFEDKNGNWKKVFKTKFMEITWVFLNLQRI